MYTPIADPSDDRVCDDVRWLPYPCDRESNPLRRAVIVRVVATIVVRLSSGTCRALPVPGRPTTTEWSAYVSNTPGRVRTPLSLEYRIPSFRGPLVPLVTLRRRSLIVSIGIWYAV
ncbi:hypothetical protein D8S78_01980 [Natrialba swarupiae]|nr:hypothetical protein [Natrialba swarupiae]